MATGSSFADAALQPSDEVWLASTDSKDYFYYLALDGAFSPYFSLPPIPYDVLSPGFFAWEPD